MASLRIPAWRRLPVPYATRYHVMTAYDDWAGLEGQWQTELEIDSHLAACCDRARAVEHDDVPACEALAAGVGELLRVARDAAELLPLPLFYAVLDNEREAEPDERKLPTWRAQPDEPFTIDTWHAACAREGTDRSDHARLIVARFYVEWWAPRMSYPYANQAHRARTIDFEHTVELMHATYPEQTWYPGSTSPDGKESMSARPAASDSDAGHPSASRFTAEVASEMHRARHGAAHAGKEPTPLTAEGCPSLFTAAHSDGKDPYAVDDVTLHDPHRRAFTRMAALEAPDGPGLPVVTADGQVALAYMEPRELRGLSEKATRRAYSVVMQIAANLAGGIHMLRVGDGAHKPNPRDKSVGISTAWAVFRGAWPLHNRHGRTAPQHWLHHGGAAYGGCLGPGANIDSGEVAAMIGCLREAIYARGSWARSHAHFNVVYGTDSASCAHTLEATWRTGDLAAAADSAIGSLVETWLHLRNQLHVLGATFTMFKLPGHGGVYPMAAADACARRLAIPYTPLHRR